MSFDIEQVVLNFQGNLGDIPQFSTRSLEDYSIVSRKHLQKIVNNSERYLVNIICFYVTTYQNNVIASSGVAPNE